MPFTFTMPKLSPTMEEGTIAKWHVKEGDFVKAGDVIFEVATDKATVEHSVLDSGYLKKILVPEGKSVRVGEAVAIFTEKQEESIEGYKPEGIMPEEKVVAVEEKKEEVTEPVAAKAGAMKQPSFVPEPPLKQYVFAQPSAAVRATPLAKKLAKEKGIDLTTIAGSGPNQRIRASDLDLGQPNLEVAFGRHETPTIPPGTYEEEALTPMRKVIGQRLQESKTFIPHFYVSQDIDADSLVQTREQLKNMGLKLSFNDFVIRATALSLREHPEINSGFNSVNSTLIRFKTVDIAIAVSLKEGLITPIIRHADYKNLGEISAEMKLLAQRAREGKLKREEYSGGSFTISNLGMYGVSEFIGVINPPQAAILAVSGIEDVPVVKEGRVLPGKRMRLTLSADHRVVDGADGAKFLKSLQKFLENPASLLIS